MIFSNNNIQGHLIIISSLKTECPSVLNDHFSRQNINTDMTSLQIITKTNLYQKVLKYNLQFFV